MSEAELHLLRARIRGGILAWARRGKLALPLPVGLVYDPAGARRCGCSSSQAVISTVRQKRIR